jgi:hypothetical protein
VALVQREHVRALVSPSAHDDRGIGQAELEVRVPLDDGHCGNDVFGTKGFQL